jgi:hypothetical protein
MMGSGRAFATVQRSPDSGELAPATSGLRRADGGDSRRTEDDLFLTVTPGSHRFGVDAVAPPPPDLGGGGSLRYLRSLQRSAGNSAVGALLGHRVPPAAVHVARRSRLLSVQACGPTPCSCPEAKEESGAAAEEHAEEGVPVQRVSLADVAAVVLPSWVTELATSGPKEARDLAGKVTDKGKSSVSDSKAQADQSAKESQTGAESLTNAGKQQTEAQAHAAAAEAAGAEKSANVSTAAAQAGAVRLGGAASAASGLVNPLGPMVELPGFQSSVGHVSSVVSALPGGVSDLASDIKKSVTDGLKAGQTEGWDCDQSEIMAMVGGVERAVADAAVKAGKKILGTSRYEALSKWVQARIADVKTVAGDVKKGVGKIEAGVKTWWDVHVAPLAPKVQHLVDGLKSTWNGLKTTVSTHLNTFVTNVGKAWSRIKTDYIDPAVTLARSAAKSARDIFNRVKGRIGTWWKHLPSGLQNLIMGIGAIVAGPAGIALAAAEKAGAYLAAHRSSILSNLKKLADGFFQNIAKAYTGLKDMARTVVKGIKDRGRSLIAKIKLRAKQIHAAIDKATGGKVSKFLAGLERMRKKIDGEVCTEIGEVAGPCIEQFVPDVGPNAKTGESSDVTLTTSAEVTVPVYEVPVKVGEGASAKISRRGKAYTLTLEGNGLLAVATPTAQDPNAPDSSSTNVSVQGLGNIGKGATIWKALTGKGGPAAPAAPAATTATGASGGAAPATAAPTPTAASGGAAPAPAAKTPATSGGGGGAGPAKAPAAATPPGATPAKSQGGGDGTSAEAGVKCSVSMAFGFDAGKDSTCDGLGGLVALLANCGLSYSLPPPFSAMVGAATQAAYAQNVTACTVTLAEYGKAEVDLLKSGAAGLKAAMNAEASVTASHALVDPTDPSKGWQDTATLTETAGGTVAAQLAAGGEDPLNLAGVGGTAGASASVYATLVYSEKADVVTAASAGAKLGLTLELNRGQVMSTFPERITQRVLPQIEPYLENASKGLLTVTAQASLENLQELAAKLDAYFATPAAVTSSGVIKIVEDHFSTAANVKKSVTVTVTITETIGKVELSEKDKDVSGKVSASLEKHQTKVLYP